MKAVIICVATIITPRNVSRFVPSRMYQPTISKFCSTKIATLHRRLKLKQSKLKIAESRRGGLVLSLGKFLLRTNLNHT